MRLIVGFLLAALCIAGAWLWFGGHYAETMRWALAQQRVFQNELAQFIMAARRGESGIVWGLIAASGLYGFVHALGPGHGKFLLGSAGIGSRATARAMAGLAFASALAQGLTAVVLVYGGLSLLSMGTRWAEDVTNDVLTPLSYAVIVGIGIVLIWRGLRAAWRHRLARRAVSHGDHRDGVHGESCGGGHRHGPTVEEIGRLRGWRDAAALVAGIAIRPCTGAVIILVIAWQTGLHAIGLAAVLAMSLGTGAFTALVALASVSVREGSFLASAGATNVALVAPALQVLAGGLILIFSSGLLWASLA